mgnify:CR=1 FL=1
MGLNRLLKKLLPGETLEEALYKKLTENTLNENLYKTDELGEGMGVVYQVINGWWKPRYILNHNTRTAFEFMSHSQYLLTVETEDIEWSSLKKLPEGVINNAKTQFAMFPTFVEDFQNGVARVRWQINPDGRYYMDDDGYGMTDDEEVEIYGYINKEGKVVGKFRLPCEKDKNVDFRKLAEEVEMLNRK